MKSKVLLLLCLLLNSAKSSSDPGLLKIPRLRLMNNASLTSSIQQPEIDQNFENGSVKPWIDCSEYGTQWVIENISTAWDNELSKSHISPPTMESGENYLWLKQDLETFGIGILKSPKFVVYPGDEIQFSFWIHSSFEYFNNLQARIDFRCYQYMNFIGHKSLYKGFYVKLIFCPTKQVFWSVVGIKEDRKLIELFPASSFSENTEWRQSLVQIPIFKPTEGELMIYGFCEPKSGAGLIAVDNIFLIHQSTMSTENAAPTTSSKPVLLTNGTEFSKFSEMTTKLTELTTDVSLSTIFAVQEECPFQPCSPCEQRDSSTYNLVCSNLSTKQLRDEIFKKYNENSYEFDVFEMIPPFNDTIPFDMFASAIRYVNWFKINCTYIARPYEVDPFAFKPNLPVGNLIFQHCNFVNLTFLSQFSYVRDLKFENSSNLPDIFNTFPEDFKVNTVRFVSCDLLDLTMDDFPPHSMGLGELRIYDNPKIDDNIVDLFVSWVLDFSRDSLTYLYLYNNGLKKIPTGLSRFNRLAYLRIDDNLLQLGVVKKGELKFSDYTRLLNIWNCGIHTIEPGAFGGIYELANVYIDRNNLTRFESNAFQDILTQMALLGDLDNGGMISVAGNLFDCVDDPCHLTWLLRDNNRSFLPFVWDGACANGTLFTDIQPDDPMFNDCP